jgi:hypothetical protein
MKEAAFKIGQPARIRRSIHSPYSGRVGTVLDVEPSDTKGAYLVSFSDGLQFRYSKREIESLDAVHSFSVVEMVLRVIHLYLAR